MNQTSLPVQNVQDEDVTTVRRLQRKSRWLAALTLLLVMLALTTAFPLMSVGACLSWPVAIAAMVVAMKAFWQVRRLQQGQLLFATKRATVLTMSLCLVLLIGCTVLNMLALGLVRTVSKRTISAANLMGIGISVERYTQKHGTYPPSLNAFVSDGSMSPKSLVNPFDHQAPQHYPDGQLTYSSYIYKPGIDKYVQDSAIIIAYEQEAFDVCEPYLFAPKERWVLFGDGQVTHLTEAEFVEAIRKDEQRRRELRWPTSAAPVATAPSKSPG